MGSRVSWAGFGAQLIVINDPVKSRAEAESEVYKGAKSMVLLRAIFNARRSGRTACVSRWHGSGFECSKIKDGL